MMMMMIDDRVMTDETDDQMQVRESASSRLEIEVLDSKITIDVSIFAMTFMSW